jgi:DNA-binding protein H-NS
MFAPANYPSIARSTAPSMTELKSYDLPELEALAERIKAEIARREQEEEAQAQRAIEDAAAAAETERIAKEKATQEAAAAAEQAAETERLAREASAAEATSIRYMHPSNRALTWSGIGPKPDWVNAWLVTGGTLYALEIAAEKLAPKPIPESFKRR